MESFTDFDSPCWQLRFEGMKTYREDNELKQVSHELKEVKIPPRETTWSVTNLKPKMKFEFNISAVFRDGEEGSQQHLVTETLIDGQPFLFLNNFS